MSINYLDKTGLEHIGDIANYKKRNIDYTTYTGTDLDLEDTLENKIDFNNLYGQTEQDGTPTPTNPIEIKTVTGRQVVKITGKNLFNKNTVESGKIVSRTDGTLSDETNYNASDYIPMKENTTYTLTALNFNRWYSACYDENKNYIGYVEDETTFTTISGTKYMRFTVYNDLMDTAMIVEGNTLPDTYEEYKEQSYELNLGKNLFDKDNMPILDLYIDGNTIKESSYNKMLYIPCKPNTTYTLQKIASAYSRQIAYTTELPAVNVNVYGKVDIPANNTQSKITTGSDAKYLVCRFYQVTQDANISLQQMLDSIMIEKGEEATSYSPYFTPIELCEIGDYQDSIKKSTGKNLFGLNSSGTDNGINYNYTNGVLTLNGTSTTNSGNYFNGEITLPPGTYTISFNLNKTPGVTFGYYLRDKNNMSASIVDSGNLNAANASNYKTFTLSEEKTLVSNVFIPSGSSVSDLKMNIQLERGNTATDLEPYGVGKWYVEKKTRHISLAVADMDNSDDYPGWRGVPYLHDDCPNKNTPKFPSTIQSNIGGGEYHYGLNTNATNSLLFLNKGTWGLTQTQWKTNYPNLVVELYYGLQTPYYEEITDEELIELLNDLYDAFYMNSKTYINVEGDLPIVLEINHDEPRFLNLIDKGELQKYIIDLEKRAAIYWNHK